MKTVSRNDFFMVAKDIYNDNKNNNNKILEE